MKTKIIFILILFFICNSNGQEKRHWQFEYMPGFSYVPPMPLYIHQNGYDPIKIRAHYITRSFEMPIYYSYRLSTWKETKGWSIELNHLKIYLDNTSPEIEDFSVSHGYNQIFLNRHILKDKFVWIVGGGVVLGHPESIIRGQRWHETGGLWNLGYYLSGISAQGALYFPVINTKYITIPLEAKITIGYGHVPIADGEARVPIISFNILSGLGINY